MNITHGCIYTCAFVLRHIGYMHLCMCACVWSSADWHVRQPCEDSAWRTGSVRRNRCAIKRVATRIRRASRQTCSTQVRTTSERTPSML